MKIIGITENGYILDADKNEIANLTGYYSTYDEKFKGLKIKIGDEIAVHDMYQQLYTLANKKQDLSQVVRALKNMTELLEPVAPVIEKVFENVLKDSEVGK